MKLHKISYWYVEGHWVKKSERRNVGNEEKALTHVSCSAFFFYC